MPVDPSLRQTAENIQDDLATRDVRSLGIVAGGVFTGVLVAQEVADLVLDALGRPIEPSTMQGFGLSAAVKFLTALVVGFGASTLGLGGLPLVFVAFVAVGHLAGGAADIWNAIQRSGFLAEHTGGRTGGSRSDSNNTASGGVTQSTSGQPAVADGGWEVEDPEPSPDTGNPALDGGELAGVANV